MDTIILILVIIVLLWFAMRFFGNRAPTRPTYDDKDIRSGGSIGGAPGQPGQRTHDDPNIQSGGSIGGTRGAAAPRTHDDPNIRSGGSIGGSNVTGNEGRAPVERSAPPVSPNSGIGERRNPFNDERTAVSPENVSGLGNRAAGMRDDDDAAERLRREAEANTSSQRRAADDDDDTPRRKGDDPNIRSGGSFGG